ncbi:MAG: dihydrodipicolinate synthase family protein, partial [bacterium]|nr:dihydrodipicolinate synthase family protein [bacterium]
MPTARLSEDASGVYIISATPFDDGGALDLASADRLVDYYLEAGISGMTILGMMGEAPKLAPDEAVSFAKHILTRVDGRVPVVVGVSNAGLVNLARLSKTCMAAGAAGVSGMTILGMLGEAPKLAPDEAVSFARQVLARVDGRVPVVVGVSNAGLVNLAR